MWLKKQRIIEIKNFINEELAKDKIPSYNEVNRRFHLSYYKIKLADIYFSLGFNILNYPIKRPNKSYELLREQLINYVKGEVKKEYFPSRREIENKFGIRLGTLFKGIEDVYTQCGLPYIQKSSQLIKTRKAKILAEIVLSILPKLGLKLIKSTGVHQQGIDMITIDKKSKTIGIELKAFNKYEIIKSKNISQAEKFLYSNKFNKIFIITSTDKIQKNLKIHKKIGLIPFSKLKTLCNQEELDLLKFIRNFSIHQETEEKDVKRMIIVQYTKEKFNKGENATYNSILKNLNLDLYTYFEDIYDLYEKAGLPIPLNKIRGFRRSKKPKDRTAKFREQFIISLLDFIKKEVEKGHYPSGIDIGKKFGISHIWNYIKVSDLYRKLGIPPYLERRKLGLQSVR